MSRVHIVTDSTVQFCTPGFAEDHAFTVVEHDGEEWIVDSYNDHFNGYRLKDLMKEGGPRPGDPVAPVRRTYRYRRVVRINDYPRYWIPKEDRR